ncbi:multiple C2 domain and transmembrane region protein 16-like [Musa acuminata AAA Group]|uniref:multiple C2 domain and transmembrane region protein 16-like n=1 Tax=Musa acuminata AAA Group TaxID=214697 RepID=UPI0031D45313
MASMARKLVVEVMEAHDLLPKDGMGTSSPYVVVDFDGQRRKTQTVLRNLSPTWNEALEFNVIGPVDDAGEPVEVEVYHDRRVGPSRRNNFLGRVRIDSRKVVKKGEEAVESFPVEKKSFFSWVRGDIYLKVYYVDEPVPEPKPPAPPSEAAPKSDERPPPAEAVNMDAGKTDAPVTVQPTEAAEQAPDTAAPESEKSPPPPPPPEEPPVAAAETEKPKESDAPPPVTENGGTGNPAETAEANPSPLPEPSTEAPPPPPEPEKESTPNWVPQPRQMAPPARSHQAMERSKYDLVDKMQYLFVRVVRARKLPGNAKPHVRVAAYGRHVSTRTARRSVFFEWNQTFAFVRDASAAAADPSALEISVWDLPPFSDLNDEEEEHFLGGVRFDVAEVPLRDPPDSPLAPQWYRLEGGRGRGGDLMLASWVGTQADDSFPHAWKADAPTSHAGSHSKVYVSPKLWYIRATVIEAQDTVPSPIKEHAVYVRAALGFQVLKTRNAVSRNGAPPSWNEDLLFVEAEPFGEDQKLVISLELRHGKDAIVLGSASILLSTIERRVDDRKVASRWLDLLPTSEEAQAKKGRRPVHGFRLHVRVCFDGGYHVSDEPQHAESDYRPSARQLWRSPVGVVEVGIIGCRGLLPVRTVDGKGTTDAYAVAKYGPKWARTRTAANSFDPAWNEQYTWPVYDPCTVLTVAVFDQSDDGKDATSRPMGKVRIRLSTLETNRIYRGSYPLVMLLPSGVKRMGEIELAVRFSRAGSALDLLHVYGQPMLPAMHHLRPIPAAQREPLRLAAARIVAAHLGRSEPSLQREVALWVLDPAAEPRGYSMRRVRANWYRIVAALSWVADVARWVEDTRAWRNATTTLLVHGVLVLLVWFPELGAPTVAVHVAVVGAWRYRRRARGPVPHPCLRASQAEAVEREELDEEFDPVPSARGPEVVRARYDRMRGVAARFQAMLGDVAAQVERVQALVTWRDPRATGMFVALCFLLAVALYVVPARMAVVAAGFYYLRHPMFRDRLPPAAVNFYRRLPSLADRII